MKSLLFSIILLALGFYAYSGYFIITILAISFLIFFHELGHFIAARLQGVKVEVFSIGFGETVFERNFKNTKYKISAIPLGGYVQLKGQDDSDPNKINNDPDSYYVLSPIGKIIILFAGPAFNFILAFFLYIVLAYMPQQRLAPVVGTVLPNSPAYMAGIISGDKILKINNISIKEWKDVSALISSDKQISIQINRKNEIINLNLTPKIGKSTNIFGEEIQKPLIGIAPIGEYTQITNSQSPISYAINETLSASKLIFVGVGKLISGSVPLKEMGGIVQITDITSKAASTSITLLLSIIALISVNLGVLNLLPIPALDGGHIVFNIYELITRNKVPQKAFAYLTYAGWAILATLMIIATFNDIMRISGLY